MAQVPIEILDLRQSKDGLIVDLIEKLNSNQNQLIYSLLSNGYSTDLMMSVRVDTEMDSFFASYFERKTRWKGYHPFVIGVFDTAINHNGTYNLFSVDQVDEGFVAFTTHNVSPVLMRSDQIAAYLINRIAFFSLKFMGNDLAFHRAERSCLFDYKENKSGIVNSICKPLICDSCKEKIQKKDSWTTTDQIDAVLSMLNLGADAFANVETSTVKKSKTRLFIGSSVEGLKVAQAIQAELEHDFDVEVWNQSDVFGLGTSTLEALENAVRSYDFGVFVFTPDDQITMREQQSSVARDNVIFEAGLFMGKLTRFRTFVVRPRSPMQIPSDLSGITTATYDPSKTNIVAAVGTACTRIRDAIKSHLD